MYCHTLKTVDTHFVFDSHYGKGIKNVREKMSTVAIICHLIPLYPRRCPTVTGNKAQIFTIICEYLSNNHHLLFHAMEYARCYTSIANTNRSMSWGHGGEIRIMWKAS